MRRNPNQFSRAHTPSLLVDHQEPDDEKTWFPNFILCGKNIITANRFFHTRCNPRCCGQRCRPSRVVPELESPLVGPRLSPPDLRPPTTLPRADLFARATMADDAGARTPPRRLALPPQQPARAYGQRRAARVACRAPAMVSVRVSLRALVCAHAHARRPLLNRPLQRRPR